MQSLRTDLLISTALSALCVAGAFAGAAYGQAEPVNVLQDCWTTQETAFIEDELYRFLGGEPVTFVWKHKILLPCENYVYSIYGFQCRDGKPNPGGPGGGVAFSFENNELGAIEPDPDVPERLFTFTGAVPPGRWDWILVAECNDLGGNGIPIGPDGDIDDQCGINVGTAPVLPAGPVIYGPDPVEVFDPSPGGSPPGRGPGEEGTTRPWCFEVD